MSPGRSRLVRWSYGSWGRLRRSTTLVPSFPLVGGNSGSCWPRWPSAPRWCPPTICLTVSGPMIHHPAPRRRYRCTYRHSGRCCSPTESGSNVAHPGYRLTLPPGSLDLQRFSTLVGEARCGDPAISLDRYDRAAALWRGPLLADLADEQFVRVASVQLVEQRRAALVGEMQALLGLGRPDEAAAALRNLTSAEPGHERWWSLLMRALYDSGRPADAAAVFAEARAALAEETGLDPSPALSELHRAILRHDIAVASTFAAGDTPRSAVRSAAAVQSPVSGRPLWQVLGGNLIGREDLIDSARELVASGETVTLVGAAGVGKSAVAAAVAIRVSAAVGSTVAFVALDDRVRLGEATPRSWI